MIRTAVFLVPLAAAAVLYAPTPGYDLTFDDQQHVTPPGSPDPRTLAAVWSEPYWELDEGGLYRPVLSTSFWLESRVRASLALRHTASVLLHVLVTGLLVRLVLSLGLGMGAAASIGVLFAVHPVHVEAVAGLVGRGELLAAVWMLAALWLHDRGGSRRPALLWGSVLAFLAAGTKESAWALPLFAAGLDLARGRRLAAAWPAWLAYGAGIGTHLLLRHQVLGGWLNAPAAAAAATAFDNPLVALDGWPRLLGGLRIAGLNLGHLVFPVTLAPDYSGPQIDIAGGLLDPRLMAGALLVLGCVAGVVLGLRRRSEAGGRALLLGAGWLLITAFLVMNLVFDLGTPLADRLLYWPSAAWLLGMGGLAHLILDRPALGGGARRRVRSAGWLLVVIAAAAYAVRAARYLPDWKDDETLFHAAVQTVPRSPRVWYNRGWVDHRAGRPGEALVSYRRARELVPDYQKAWAQEAAALVQLERWDEATAALDHALRLHPEDRVSLLNQGVVWLNRGQADRAAGRFRDLLDTAAGGSDGADAAYNLALAETRLERWPDAETSWRRTLELRPGDAGARNNLAWLLATERGRPAEAESLARAAAAAEPGNPEFLDTLAEALFRQGKVAEARAAARRALSLEDSHRFRERLERFGQDP